MKCPFCGSDILDDSLFCSECGAKLEIDAPKIEPEADDLPKNSMESEAYRQESHPKKNKTVFIVIGGVVLGLVLIALLVTLLFGFIKRRDKVESETTEVVEEIVEVGEENAEASDEVIYDLTKNDRLYGTGYIKKSYDGAYVFQKDEMAGYLGLDEDGEECQLSGVDRMYIDESELPEGFLATVDPKMNVYVGAKAMIKEGALYIAPTTVKSDDGDDLVYKYKEQKEKEETNVLEEDYIIPGSDNRLLTNADIEGLSLRELNYAKNEIYARHGRRFQSQELQRYFDGKHWYHGRVEPSAFDNSCLTDIERKNAEFLATAEFNMDPVGYKLDAN